MPERAAFMKEMIVQAVASQRTREKRITHLFNTVWGNLALIKEAGGSWLHNWIMEYCTQAVDNAEPRPVKPLPAKTSAAGQELRKRREDLAASKRRGSQAMNKVMSSMLYRFPINGKPLGDVSVRELASYYQSHQRDNLFIGMIVERVKNSVPLLDSPEPVKLFIEVEEADACYREAQSQRAEAAD
jgi:hypothetical protein